MSWKRPLFLFHRWAGIVLCLFFGLWFLSGLFMMYVEFPQLTPPERRAGEAPLDFSSARMTPGDTFGRLQVRHFAIASTPTENRLLDFLDRSPVTKVDHIQLGMLFDRPVYRVYVAGVQPRVVFADTGELLSDVTPAMALQSARDFASRAGLPFGQLQHLDVSQTDQWTVSSALNPHRPLHRIALNDQQGTQLYVSSSTAEVVRDTHSNERRLNYLGAVTHWIYPTILRRHPDAWAWVIDILASAGTLLAISGLWIGILRWRRQRTAGTSISPYSGMMRWHHLTGLLFGVLSVTWVFSGLLSMNPGRINPSRSPAEPEALVFSGKSLTPADFGMLSTSGSELVEADLLHVDGHPFYKVVDRDGDVRLVAGSTAQPASIPTAEQLLKRAPLLMPNAPLVKAKLHTAYDNYYYSRHPEQGNKPLPFIRVEFGDEDHTWFHIDPLSAQVLERSTRFNRAYRWLYNGLHSFDIQWLWNHRPLWDITVILFSLGGLLLSGIGLVAGVRRLRWELGITPLQPKAARAAVEQQRANLSALSS